MPLKGQKNPIARENGKLGGRPITSATLRTQMLKDALGRRFVKDSKRIFDAWTDAALGRFMAVKLPSGEERVYKKAPNVQAIRDMWEAVNGKPTQPVEHSGGIETSHTERAAVLATPFLDNNEEGHDEDGQEDQTVAGDVADGAVAGPELVDQKDTPAQE